MEYGKVIDASRGSSCLLRPEGGGKIVKVSGIPWRGIKEEYRIPYEITKVRKDKSTDLGKFYDKTKTGSIVVIGHSLSDYERPEGVPEGIFFGVMGCNDLFKIVNDTFEQSEWDGIDKSGFSKVFEYGGYNYFWGHQADPKYLDVTLAKLLGKFSTKEGSETKPDYFIHLEEIAADKEFIEVNIPEKQEFANKVLKLFIKKLLE